LKNSKILFALIKIEETIKIFALLLHSKIN